MGYIYTGISFKDAVLQMWTTITHPTCLFIHIITLFWCAHQNQIFFYNCFIIVVRDVELHLQIYEWTFLNCDQWAIGSDHRSTVIHCTTTKYYRCVCMQVYVGVCVCGNTMSRWQDGTLTLRSKHWKTRNKMAVNKGYGQRWLLRPGDM